MSIKATYLFLRTCFYHQLELFLCRKKIYKNRKAKNANITRSTRDLYNSDLNMSIFEISQARNSYFAVNVTDVQE